MNATKITAEPGQPFVDVVREFDAPRELVYQAHVDPALIVEWLGPARFAMTLDRWDPRDGGSWRYTHRDDDGNEYGFHVVFHGSQTIDGMTQTFEFEGAPGHVSLGTVTFEDIGDGRSRALVHSVYQSVQDRDAVVESGMGEGMSEGYRRLDELLGKLVPVA
jgi:uncharacterized protein YndB with AHSA1/START domain